MHLNTIEELAAKLRTASCEIVRKEQEIAKLKQLLDVKESQMNRVAMDNRELQRKLRSASGLSLLTSEGHFQTQHNFDKIFINFNPKK